MAAPNIIPYTNEYVFGRGRPLIDLLVDDVYQGYVPLGNCPGFNIDVEGEQYQHTNSEGGIAEIDLTALVDNYRALRTLAKDSEPMAVVKADAYGHGAVAVSRALVAEGVLAKLGSVNENDSLSLGADGEALSAEDQRLTCEEFEDLARELRHRR